jgi:ATP phosphoribosyltransferase regulatory subunit
MQYLNINELSERLIKKNEVLRCLETLVNEKGYIKVEPDYFEPYERFIQLNKRIKKETMVKIQSLDGSISLLRPDITTNLMNLIVPIWSKDNALKIYYVTSTFRQNANEPILETKQFGLEYLGGKIENDREILFLILSIFKSLNLDFILEIGHQKFLNALFKSLNLSETKEVQLKDIINDKNQFELNRFIKTESITGDNKYLLTKIFQLEGSLERIIEMLETVKLNSVMTDAINELRLIKNYLANENLLHAVTIDLSSLSSYDYYNGVTFKGYIKNVPFAILSGGRYDMLTKEFGQEVPAIGFSIDLNEVLKEVL